MNLLRPACRFICKDRTILQSHLLVYTFPILHSIISRDLWGVSKVVSRLFSCPPGPSFPFLPSVQPQPLSSYRAQLKPTHYFGQTRSLTNSDLRLLFLVLLCGLHVFPSWATLRICVLRGKGLYLSISLGPL